MSEAGGGLATRAASALVLGTLAVLAVIAGGWVFTLAMLALAVVMGWEWSGLVGAPRTWPLPAAIALVWLVAVGLSPGWALAAAAAVAVGFWMAINPWLAAGVAYVAVPLLAVLWLRMGGVDGTWLLLWLFAVIWATDVGAYAAGRIVGGPRLAPTWSPNKTWAGAAGGVTGAMAVSAILIEVGLDGHPWFLLVAAAAISVLGQVGDLTESVVKRRFGRKDSGSLIPGHGGILDRLDSMVLGAPGLAALVALVGREAWLWRINGE